MEKQSDLADEVDVLKARLAEAEQTLDAIRSGEVDALVTSGPNGDQIFTLHGAETPYRILVEEMNQGALMLNPDGTILYANNRFAGLSKTPLEQIIGTSWQDFFPGDKHEHLTAYLSAKPGSSPAELPLLASDGSLCPVHLSLHAMSTSGLEGFSVIVTDLSERHKSENALRNISDALREKNGQLEAFSYSVSHDMRAPLRSMQGFADILLQDYGGKLEPVARGHLERIVSSANLLDRLIQDVLAYSKETRDACDLASFDLSMMVKDLVEAYPHLRDAQIEVIPSSTRVRGFKVALGQCISNLLGNAIKFVPAGVSPRIKVWTEPHDGRVRLWVQDNGIGILPKNQEKIFDVFSRLHSDEEYEGTGLGLNMVKKAVEKMGGCVGVESQLGHGSRFWIELQCAALEPDRSAAIPAQPASLN